jgi:hypothetical protein
MKMGTAAIARVLPVAVATLMLVAACAETPIKGEIRDDGITLATDHAGPSVRFDLHNVGTTPCDLVDGHVVIDESGAPGTVRPITTYESAPTFTLGRVEAAAVFQSEVALEGTPKTEDRVILCNGGRRPSARSLRGPAVRQVGWVVRSSRQNVHVPDARGSSWP